MAKYFHSATETKPPYARVLLLGAPGAGKTLLASSHPDTLIFDIEDRAAHAARNRLTFTKDANGLRDILAALDSLARLKPEADGLLHWRPEPGTEIPMGAISLDSLDEVQLIFQNVYARSLSGHTYWRQMLEIGQRIVTTAKMCACHVFFVAHSKEYQPDPDEERINIQPTVSLALQGALKNQAWRWVDQAIQMTFDPTSPKAEVKLITTHTSLSGRIYMAKDTHNLFGGRVFPIQWHRETGRPNVEQVRAIFENTSGAPLDPVVENQDQFASETEAAVREGQFDPETISSWDELKAAALAVLGYTDTAAVEEAMRRAVDGDKKQAAALSYTAWWGKLLQGRCPVCGQVASPSSDEGHAEWCRMAEDGRRVDTRK
jgi:hypothetical protein